MRSENHFEPDFDSYCRECGATPCVVVVDHEHKPHTDLCGVHFFQDRRMVDWDLWNDPQDSTE